MVLNLIFYIVIRPSNYVKYYIKHYFPNLLYFLTYAIIKYERNARAACRYQEKSRKLYCILQKCDEKITTFYVLYMANANVFIKKHL